MSLELERDFSVALLLFINALKIANNSDICQKKKKKMTKISMEKGGIIINWKPACQGSGCCEIYHQPPYLSTWPYFLMLGFK